MNRLQLTLAILKPHVLLDPFAIQWIRKLILDSNFKVIRSKRKKMSQEITEKFYEEHKGRFFYNRLTGLMTRYFNFVSYHFIVPKIGFI